MRTDDASALPLEIERKFLLRALPPRPPGAVVMRIDQGWIPGDSISERVRRTRAPGGIRYFRTIKLGRGIQRVEFEDAIDEALFRPLWRLTRGRRIAKLRWACPDGPLTWEIDRFLDRDLVIAEVELDSADQAVTPPAWLAPFIVREVTDDGRYYNSRLARSPGTVPAE
jgi:CYTH domain-containing protein